MTDTEILWAAFEAENMRIAAINCRYREMEAILKPYHEAVTLCRYTPEFKAASHHDQIFLVNEARRQLENAQELAATALAKVEKTVLRAAERAERAAEKAAERKAEREAERAERDAIAMEYAECEELDPQRLFTRSQAFAIVARDGNRCARPGCDDTDLQVDHVVPWSKGGATTLENGQLLCVHHNASKGAS